MQEDCASLSAPKPEISEETIDPAKKNAFLALQVDTRRGLDNKHVTCATSSPSSFRFYLEGRQRCQ